MSKLTNNTTDLQAILDEVSSYKEIIETQDDLIAQISTVLESKSVPSLPVLSNPVTADIIPSGYEAVDGEGNLIEGTGAGLGDATVADVLTGKTFTSDAGLKVVGTLEKVVIEEGTYENPSSKNSTELTIPFLVGKNNFVLTVNEDIYLDNKYTSFITYVNGVMKINGETNTTATFDITTGKITGCRFFYGNNYNLIAW